MMLLAIETSGTQGSIAIFEGTKLVFERILSTSGARHAQTLPAEVADAIVANNLQPADIRSVAVSIGPGSFTGLRVGLTFAKTFAWLNNASLVAVDTLRAIAQQAPPEIELVTAVIDAQRKEYFAASYRWNSELHLRCAIDEVHVATLNELETNNPILGPGCQQLLSAAPDRSGVLDKALWQPHATSVGVIGLHLLGTQQFADPDSLQPVYIRLSYAEEKRQVSS
jgi:tRNA threonylcarbamoyladenosine biosynthesis protein TsaB